MSMKTYIIYCHTNFISGKSYVGLTCRGLLNRWNQHVNCANRNSGYHFHAAIRKYGSNSWMSSILEDDLTLDQAKRAERKWISELETNVTGYNVAPGGEGGEYWPRVMTLEQHESSSKRSRELMLRPGMREKISSSLKIYFSDESNRQRNKDAVKLSMTPEICEKISNATKIAMQDEQIRERFLKAHRDPEVNKRRSIALTGKPKSEAHREALKRAQKLRVERQRLEKQRCANEKMNELQSEYEIQSETTVT